MDSVRPVFSVRVIAGNDTSHATRQATVAQRRVERTWRLSRRCSRGARANRAAICHVTHVSAMTPPSDAMRCNGPATWAMPKVARGTPPKGNAMRNTSMSVCNAGPLITECRSARPLVAMAARPCSDAKRATAMGYPGAVRNHIHDMAGRNQPVAKTKPVAKRRRGVSARYSRLQYIASPTNDRGHQPQGGMEAATSSPARSARGHERRPPKFIQISDIVGSGDDLS